MKVVSFGTTLLVAWLIWILTDTAIQHSLGLGGKSRPNTRALTMLPLIRNVLFATIAVIALIVALANMGMNVTPLLAGAGVIGLAIGFGAQSLVADLITGLFIIIEDSLSIDDYVDVGGHLGTVEGLTIRTVRLRDLDGVVHTIPFSEIKSIKNYSRQFGYAMFRWPVPASMPIDDAVALVREVAMELRSDPAVYRNLWSRDGIAGRGELRQRPGGPALPFQDRADQAMGSPAGVQPAPAPAPRPGRPGIVDAAPQRAVEPGAQGEVRGAGRAGRAAGRGIRRAGFPHMRRRSRSWISRHSVPAWAGRLRMAASRSQRE
ncbi:putative small-conductance mechanosensitive channel [Pseudomonas aeruginosa]|nr:putative small-conductance mechanosensitive channel [Pseudomonas aeruginosa]